MKRKLTLMLALLFVWTGVAWSQGVTVKGVVTSEEDGLPIVGASVLVKGTTQGTITDVDGNFMISGVKADSKTLIVSFVGMKSKEVAIKNTPMHVVLKSDAEVLDEVVVTALGMKRSEKTLGYAATTMKSEDIDAGKSGSVMGGLSGKVGGVQISSAGNTGTSQKVLIRGISSLNNNSPLYIVDGVPIDNSTFRGSPTDDSSTTDFGNAANDINSEDVESVTILKGASATALYGSRAANGVVMITTKKAGVEKTVMLTGDAKRVADQVAQSLGIDEVYSELLPADKVSKVEELLSTKAEKDKLAFVGDGINDAPVLTRADIGIAMGAMGSDAAIEAADVVLMDDDPLKISKAIKISRKCLRIVYQNIIFALVIKFACLGLGAIGIANMWFAIFADVGVMIIAILNAIRALRVHNL